MVERFHQAEHESQAVNNMKRRTSKLSDIIHSSVSMVQEQLASKQISIDLELCANAFSFTDPDIARDHVIVNILTNAIKFSHMGSRVSISAESINPGQSLIKITDHGIGIPKKILERIRRQKSLSARTGTRGEHGAGHGLSVANFFAQKLGGRLSIQSVSSSIDPTNSGTITEIIL
jgi:two-component system sensor histidine kinase SaeS